MIMAVVNLGVLQTSVCKSRPISTQGISYMKLAVRLQARGPTDCLDWRAPLEDQAGAGCSVHAVLEGKKGKDLST
jgi:hypothetical protein